MMVFLWKLYGRNTISYHTSARNVLCDYVCQSSRRFKRHAAATCAGNLICIRLPHRSARSYLETLLHKKSIAVCNFDKARAQTSHVSVATNVIDRVKACHTPGCYNGSPWTSTSKSDSAPFGQRRTTKFVTDALKINTQSGITLRPSRRHPVPHASFPFPPECSLPFSSPSLCHPILSVVIGWRFDQMNRSS